MVHVRWVGYGREAVEELHSSIAAAKDADALAPVTVVVASNHLGVATRRLLASGELGPVHGSASGIAGVAFLTVFRLAELIAAPRLAGTGRRPVSTPVIAAALRKALREDPGVFAAVADHPSTETALVAAYRQLRDLSPDALRSLGAAGRRAGDVVRLQSRARALLASRWYDETDLLDAALAVLDDDSTRETGPTPVRDGLGTVVVYLPGRLSRHGAALLRALGDAGELRVVAGRTGDDRADAQVRDAVRLVAGDTPEALGHSDERPHDAGQDGSHRDRIGDRDIEVVTASDADEEVREAVRAVTRAVTAGVTLDRIAILWSTPDPYGRLVHEHLAGAGIGVNGVAVLPLVARVAPRTLLQMLELAGGDFRRDDVFAWLAGARLRHGGRPVPTAAWERISRDAGVVAGRSQWDRRLASHAQRLATAPRATDDPDTAEARAAARSAEAQRAETLRLFALELIDDLAAATDQPAGWSTRARWAHARLDALFGPASLRETWPLAERKAAERVDRALERLACLDEVEDSVSLDVFTRTLRLELETDLGRSGRIGEGVLAGSLRMGAGLDLDLVVVLGMAEGSLPRVGLDDPLLPEHERRLTSGELPLHSDDIARQHHELLATAAGARRLVLSFPRGDLRRNAELQPSRWLLDLAGEVVRRRLWADDLLRLDAPWVRHRPSHEAGLRDEPFPSDEQQYRLRSLMAARHAELDEAATTLGDDRLIAGLATLEARASRSFTRFDGNLAGLDVDSPASVPTSSTRLETWATCPFAYFVQHILEVRETENPEDRLEISPLDLGTLVHAILERFVADVLSRPRAARPRPDEPWGEADHLRLVEIAEELCGEYETLGLVGRAIFWQRDKRQLLSDLRRFLHEDALQRAIQRTTPEATELGFGLPDAELPAVEVDLPDGQTVRLRGKIDRLDLAEDGSLHVIDYKTGRADAFRSLSEDNPDAQGRKLQLAIYGLAGRLHTGRPDSVVHCQYWFTSAKGGFHRVGYPLTDDVLKHVRTTISLIVDAVSAGIFVNRPSASSTAIWVECPYCDPDGLGVADLRRRTTAKYDDPALAPLLALAPELAEGRGA